MLKFYKFYSFISTGLIYPLILTFVSGVSALIIYIFTNTELMWLVNLCFIIATIASVWSMVYLIVFTINRIIEWNIERQRRKGDKNETENN